MDVVNTEQRELTLMFTDIVGYSRLMERDQALTIEMLSDYRHILLYHIEAYAGVFIEFSGDAIFSRFDTPQAAVSAAIDIQKHLHSFNQGRDKNLPRLQTRIGIHTGDVLVREDAIFGDSVNIAARLEPLAVADGICVSQSVYHAIRRDLREPVKRLGVQSLKNIEQKICVYLIKPSGIGWGDQFYYFWETCCKKTTAYRYPITAVVLTLIVAGFYFIPRWLVPGYTANYVEIANFKNLMSTDGESDYFSAGITEAVRSQLADMRDVYIVEADKGINAPIRLEGSVQKLGDNLRIVYRLFRRDNNVQIAGGKLDGAYQDIFILQDRLVAEIARYLADEFDLQNFRPAPLKLTNDITAYDYYLQGLERLYRPSAHESVDEAIQGFSTALIHDPKFALANTGLCYAYWKKYILTNSVRWLNDAERHCLLALAQDGAAAKTYTAIGTIYRDTGRYQEAIEYLEKARNLDQDDVDAAMALASVYARNKEEQLAEKLYQETIAHAPENWIGYNGYGYFLMHQGRYDDAIANYKKVLKLIPDNLLALNNIAVNYMYKDEFNEAAQSLANAARIEPSGSIFGNTGNMYYFSGEYKKSVDMFKRALRLEPENYEWMVNIADAYRHIPGKKEVASSYYRKAIVYIKEEMNFNPNVAKTYHYMARSLACLGDLAKAKEIMAIADKLDADSIDSIYAHLRVAILAEDDAKIRDYAKRLLKAEYSVNLILADPEFSVLKERRFKDVFSN